MTRRQAAWGLYAAQQSRAPESGLTEWMARTAPTTWCARREEGWRRRHFTLGLAALRTGKSLDDFGEGHRAGPQALRQVALAAQRGLQRILLLAAEAIGFHAIDTIGDQAAFSGKPHRSAITTMDVTYIRFGSWKAPRVRFGSIRAGASTRRSARAC